jgi:hypothetical protein
LHERPMREVHCEVFHPTQLSPCVGCPRELEPKEDCAEGCDRLRIYQAAAVDISERTHTHELVGERTAADSPASARPGPGEAVGGASTNKALQSLWERKARQPFSSGQIERGWAQIMVHRMR